MERLHGKEKSKINIINGAERELDKTEYSAEDSTQFLIKTKEIWFLFYSH